MIIQILSNTHHISRKRIYLLIPIFLGLALILPSFSYSQGRLQKPDADFAALDLVPIDLARDVAWVKAREITGETISLGEVIYCSNRLGKIGTYMFVFSIGEFPFPSEEEILSWVNKGKEYEEEILAYRAPEELNMQIDPDEIMERANKTGIPLIRPDGTMSGLYKRLMREQLLKEAWKMKYGIDDYLTIYVSASYQNIPIPHYKRCLPPFYHSFDPGIKEAREVLGSSDVVLAKYYFMGVKGEFFEFTDMKNRVLINAFSGERVSDENKILNLQSVQKSPGNLDSQIQNTVREEWAECLRRVEERRIGNENDE
jgi:hypothetical protein